MNRTENRISEWHFYPSVDIKRKKKPNPPNTLSRMCRLSCSHSPLYRLFLSPFSTLITSFRSPIPLPRLGRLEEDFDNEESFVRALEDEGSGRWRWGWWRSLDWTIVRNPKSWRLRHSASRSLAGTWGASSARWACRGVREMLPVLFYMVYNLEWLAFAIM